MDPERLFQAAKAYIGIGWYLFTVREDKIPFRNCENCPPGAHGGAGCSCLRCHGHLAATRDLSRVVAMIAAARGKCALAVATGESGLAVIDAEGDDRVGYGKTGLEILDELETWTGGRGLPHRGQTLRARTGGGGLHLFYRGSVPGTNRVLPNVDVKSRGGYVVVPPAAGRRWENWSSGAVAPYDEDLFRGMPGSVAGVGGRTAGVSVLAAVAPGDVVPDGLRYEYTRDLVYKLRKNGVSWEEAVASMREAHARYAQPPAARYALPWSRVEYEMSRAWQRVAPDEAASAEMIAWAAGLRRKV